MQPHPELQFGTRLLEALEFEPDKTVLATMEPPWKLAKPRLNVSPRTLVLVQSMDREYLDRVDDELPALDTVIGIGGGSCMDCAKYIAWKRSAPPDPYSFDRFR